MLVAGYILLVSNWIYRTHCDNNIHSHSFCLPGGVQDLYFVLQLLDSPLSGDMFPLIGDLLSGDGGQHLAVTLVVHPLFLRILPRVVLVDLVPVPDGDVLH